MSYKLYTDKTELFECDVSVKNASLKNSSARLVIESEDLTIVFKGKIFENKCSIPIKKLKGILSENTKGTMCLEVIIDDTFFKPWESDFIVEEHTSLKVKVNEQKSESSKPILSVTSPKQQKKNITVPLNEISVLCSQFGITKKNSKQNTKNIGIILREYLKENPEYINQKSQILMDLAKRL